MTPRRQGCGARAVRAVSWITRPRASRIRRAPDALAARGPPRLLQRAGSCLTQGLRRGGPACRGRRCLPDRTRTFEAEHRHRSSGPMVEPRTTCRWAPRQERPPGRKPPSARASRMHRLAPAPHPAAGGRTCRRHRGSPARRPGTGPTEGAGKPLTAPSASISGHSVAPAIRLARHQSAPSRAASTSPAALWHRAGSSPARVARAPAAREPHRRGRTSSALLPAPSAGSSEVFGRWIRWLGPSPPDPLSRRRERGSTAGGWLSSPSPRMGRGGGERGTSEPGVRARAAEPPVAE